MATKTTKTSAKGNVPSKADTKSSPKKKVAAKTKVSSPNLIEKAAEEALKKLSALKIEESLQADLEWCLGSYRHDQNPSGLYTMVGRAFTILEAAAQKNKRAVSTKLLNDLSKALKNQ